MPFLYLRFYEELNDFLPPAKRRRPYQVYYHLKRTVKDLIEAEGVPHVEVDLILVNGQSVDFDYHLQPEDHVSVYPVFESFDISEVTKLRHRPLRNLKFILDVHLGKLARYLRLLGFDCIYNNYYHDPEIESRAMLENRIVLTRDKGLLKRSGIKRGYWLRHQDSQKQLGEVFGRFHLSQSTKPFTICMNCNGTIHPVAKEKVMHELLPDTRKVFDEFYQCENCKKVYWKGSHYEKMQQWLRGLTVQPTAS